MTTVMSSEATGDARPEMICHRGREGADNRPCPFRFDVTYTGISILGETSLIRTPSVVAQD
jgi:hypothetical protein